MSFGFPRLVRLTGLSKRVELNGQFGSASEFDGQRYLVILQEGGAQIRVKEANLLFMGVDSDDENATSLADDPWFNPEVPCGHRLLGGRSRVACRFECCVRQQGAESDEEWESRREQHRSASSSTASAKAAEAGTAASAEPSQRKRPRDKDDPSTPYDGEAVYQALQRRFPEDGPNAAIAKALRRCEKYEIACQGDDHADKEHKACNSEALMYARAAAVATGLEWSVRDFATAYGEAATIKRLLDEPFLGKMRAQQIHDLATSGTCQALGAFEQGLPPVGSDGRLREWSDGGRSMRHAPAKLALSKVLGISPMTAMALFEGTYKDGRFGAIRTVDELRGRRDVVSTLSLPWVRKQPVPSAAAPPPSTPSCSGDGENRGEKISIAVHHSLEHHKELQAPVPPEAAVAMLAAVRSAVRLAHNTIRGSNNNGQSLACDCPPPPPGEPLCQCCWHVEFVGGARTRGCAGHDVDLLVWHHTQPSCINNGACTSDYLIYPLVAILQNRSDAEGRLLSEREAYHRIERRSDWQRRKQADGVHRHHRSSWMTHKTHNGIENLTLCDYHDKLFGIWRAPGGTHHRIDVVMVAFPEELPFARLAWTGSRTLNRLCRLRAIHLGLNLGPHNFTAREHTTVTLDAMAGAGRGQLELRPLQVLPAECVRSEADILRILAGGTDAFAALEDPLNRNA